MMNPVPPRTVQVSTPTSTRACACASVLATDATTIVAARIAANLAIGPSGSVRRPARKLLSKPSCNRDQAKSSREFRHPSVAGVRPLAQDAVGLLRVEARGLTPLLPPRGV